MNSWEALLVQWAVALAEAELPLFVHSAKGIAVLNASEPLANGLVAALTAPATPAAPQKAA